jgi:hypothetical protein
LRLLGVTETQSTPRFVISFGIDVEKSPAVGWYHDAVVVVNQLIDELRT